MEELLWTYSGVTDDADYQEYQALDAADHLDENGHFISEELQRIERETSEEHTGTIHVSFARNDSLSVTYYKDENLSEPLDQDRCYLNPADVIYASEPVIADFNNPLYHFSGIQVRELDQAGNMKRLLSVARDLPGAVYHIPEDYSGTELAIVPLGEYSNRTVKLSAGYILSDGSSRELENGIWDVNGKRYGNGLMELHPMESYRVSYDYGFYKDNWYFAESSPESYWDNSSDGTIVFLAGPSDQAYMEYSVLLHTYGSMKIANGVSYKNAVDSFFDSASTIFGNKSVIETQNIIELIQVNGITAINNFSDTEINIPKLRVGDEILIRVPADLKIIAEGLQLPPSVMNNESREYRFLIPDTENMAFRLSVTRRNSDGNGVYHPKTAVQGTLTIYDSSGIAYTEGSELPAEQERVTVEIIPDKDLCIYGKNITDNVYRAEMTYGDFLKNYDDIISSHPVRPGIKVRLDIEDEMGDCIFWSRNTRLDGDVILREDQDLQFDYILDQDAGFEIVLAPEDRGAAINIWSPYAANRQLEVTREMDGKTLRCRDYLTLKEGVHTDGAENPF